jgi:hypothetical protein
MPWAGMFLAFQAEFEEKRNFKKRERGASAMRFGFV